MALEGEAKKEEQQPVYWLTIYLKIIYNLYIIFGDHMNFEIKIESALQDYWKLKAIDSMENISSREVGIISSLIENEEITSILLK